jgi:flagellar biosynthesis protein FlhB
MISWLHSKFGTLNLFFFLKKTIQLKVRNMNWLINRKSQLSLENKITIHKTIIKPVWTYGIELWGCSKPPNKNILQTFQSKTLRKLANALRYISNVTLHNDLRIPYVTEVIRTYAKKHKYRTAQNNQLIRDLFNQPEIGRRFNRMWPEDLIR